MILKVGHQNFQFIIILTYNDTANSGDKKEKKEAKYKTICILVIDCSCTWSE